MSAFKLFERWIDPLGEPSHDGRIPPEGLGFIWHFARQSKGPFVAMLVAGGLTSIVEVMILGEIGRLIDLLETTPKDRLVADHWMWFAAMLVLILIGRTVSLAAMTFIEQQTVVPGYFNRVRWQSHRQVQRQSLGFFQNDFAGRIAAKVMTSGMAAGDFIVNLMQNIWLFVVYVIATLWAFTNLDWRLVILFAAWIAAFASIGRIFVPKVRDRSRRTAELSSMVTGRIVDSYTNAQTVKLFADPDREDRFIRAGMEEFVRGISSFTRALTSMRVSLSLVNSVLIAAVGALSVVLWLEDALTLGAIAFAIGLVMRLTTLSTRMLGQFNALFRNFGTVQNSAELIGQPSRLNDRPDADDLQVTDGRIGFEDVRFGYEKDGGYALKGVTLKVAPGERVGIVGPSGAGKSTMVNLLLRFFDLDAGRIVIDGQSIADVSQTSLRSQIGVVTQDTSLLHRSIFDNIAYGRPEATRDDVEQAARRAEAHAFIEGLRDQRGRLGYDAHVGERGVKLSGGQRQRIAIARVLLKNAPILVLDEATSALDSEIEAVIQARLYDLMEGKTVIAIAHRLSTIAAMDRLVVMDAGRIVEEGSHGELLQRGGLYARLWERQSGGFLAVDAAAE